MQADLIGYLRTLTDLAARLGAHNTRPAIDWNVRPSPATLPALTIQTISPGNAYDQESVNAVKETRIQFDLWGDSYAAARLAEIKLTEGLHAIDNTTHGTTVFIRALKDSDRDLGAMDELGGLTVHHIAADWIIYNRPA